MFNHELQFALINFCIPLAAQRKRRNWYCANKIRSPNQSVKIVTSPLGNRSINIYSQFWQFSTPRKLICSVKSSKIKTFCCNRQEKLSIKRNEFPAWMRVEWESRLVYFPFLCAFVQKRCRKCLVSRGNFPQLGHLQSARKRNVNAHYLLEASARNEISLCISAPVSARTRTSQLQRSGRPWNFATGRSQLVMFVLCAELSVHASLIRAPHLHAICFIMPPRD